MNKLLFNEGGQPVFLDDLELMQAEPLSQLGMLLKALGAGTGTYLLKEKNGKMLGPVGDDKESYYIGQNWLVKDGAVYELPGTNIILGDNDVVYVGVKTVETDERNFDDGQSHACRRTATAYYSTVKTDDDMVKYNDLKEIWSLIALPIKRNTPVATYIDINVSFHNGYSGTVQYMDVGDAYRVRIDIKSNAASWETLSGELDSTLFYFTDKGFPYAWSTFYVDVVLGVGGDTEARAKHAILQNSEGNLRLNGVADNDVNRPMGCAVKTIFEIPK